MKASFKYILKRVPSSVKKSFFFKSGGQKPSCNMKTVQPNKKNFLVLESVWKSASKILQSHIKIKKS